MSALHLVRNVKVVAKSFVLNRLVRLRPKVVQISPEWNKSWSFSDIFKTGFSTFSGVGRQNVLKSDLINQTSIVLNMWKKVKINGINHSATSKEIFRHQLFRQTKAQTKYY